MHMVANKSNDSINHFIRFFYILIGVSRGKGRGRKGFLWEKQIGLFRKDKWILE